MSDATKLSFTVRASRIDTHSSQARCKDALITLDTDLEDEERLASISHDAARQLLMVLIGMDGWRSDLPEL